MSILRLCLLAIASGARYAAAAPPMIRAPSVSASGGGSTVTMSVSPSAPSGVTDKLDKSFPGFGCETQSLPDYAGQPISKQLLKNIQQRTGGNNIIRVGGTSLDNMKGIDEGQEEAVAGAQKGWNVPSGITLGKKWFEAFSGWDSTTKFIIDVPLKNNLNGQLHDPKTSQKFLDLGLKYIGDNLQAVEIGNEPNLYMHGEQDPGDYSKDWHAYQDILSSSLKGKLNGKPFQALSLSGAPSDTTAGHTTGDTGKNRPNWALTSGWFDDTNGFDYSQIQSVSMHYYQTNSPDGNQGVNLQKLLMDHGATTQKTNAFRDSIKYAKDLHLDFVMGEVGSSYNGKTNSGQTQTDDFGLEAVLGAALWTVDWMLYAMSQGVARVNMQLGVGFAYAAWQPIPTNTTPAGAQPAMVSAPYYAHLFVADFIGPEPDVRMQELPADLATASGNPDLVAYGAYAAGRLVRVAVLNLHECSAASPAACPRQDMAVNLPDGARGFAIDRLTGPADKGAQARGEEMAYAGKTYTWANGGKGEDSALPKEEVTVEGKSVRFSVRQSEAVLLTVLKA